MQFWLFLHFLPFTYYLNNNKQLQTLVFLEKGLTKGGIWQHVRGAKALLEKLTFMSTIHLTKPRIKSIMCLITLSRKGSKGNIDQLYSLYISTPYTRACTHHGFTRPLLTIFSLRTLRPYFITFTLSCIDIPLDSHNKRENGHVSGPCFMTF